MVLPLALLSFFSACLDLQHNGAQRSIPIAVLSCLLIKYSNFELTESNYFFELGYRAVIKLGTERLLRTSALLLLSSWARDRLNQGVHSCVHSSDVLLPPRFRPAPSVARAFPLSWSAVGLGTTKRVAFRVAQLSAGTLAFLQLAPFHGFDPTRVPCAPPAPLSRVARGPL